ncbi:MAG: hypothetical protein F4W95_07355 [Chloroflexi bacterium]|nr:hypothetical protein [Chloroflexota bacterium]MYD48288.1 hypothetical protein [Chloroflexota bacterium]
MSKSTRKYVWPVSAVMAFALVAALAAFTLLATSPGPAAAHDPGTDHSSACPTGSTVEDLAGRVAHDAFARTNSDTNPDGTAHNCANPGASTDPGNGGNGGGMTTNNMVTAVDSTSANAGVNITVAVNDLTRHLPPGSSVVVYLEDDYVVPSAISASSVYFVATGSHSRAASGFTYGAVPAVISPTVKTGAYVTADKKDYAIRVLLPNFCTDGASCGLESGQSLTMKITSAAGIKNPSEAGSHSTYVDVLGPADDLQGATAIRGMDKVDFKTYAKIGLSSVDGSRGDELTVTGSGFNNGTSAAAYVYNSAMKPSCADIIRMGARAGAGSVGSDDKVAITFEVTVPTFMPGGNNYICMVDGEGRMSDMDVEDFHLDPSISVSPKTATVGDTVTVFAQDFATVGATLSRLRLAGQQAERGVTASSATLIAQDGSATATFVVPGWAEGTLRLDADWGDEEANTKLTVIGSTLNISKSQALANELLTITGDGFGTHPNNFVPASQITIDGVPLQVHDESLIRVNDNNGNSISAVDVSSSGQFVATVVLWPAGGSTSNPTLTAGTHTIKVVDNRQYSGTVTVTIPEATIMVTPGVAGPRDIVTVAGENWPIDNLEGDAIDHVSITVDDGNRQRTYSVFPDSAGRFFVEHRVATNVAIPSTNRVTATFGSEVVKLATFEVPAAIIMVAPGEGQPGDVVSLSVDKMPVYSSVDRVQIAGRDVLPVGNFSTNRNGSVTVSGVIIPGLDPGVYSVLLDVDDTVAIGSLEVLSEGAIGTAVPVSEGLAPLDDHLEAAFYFDNVSKTWSFYDPRPEFADLNTLTDLVNGEAYWVLIDHDVDDVVLNNKSRSLTCAGGDCWNLVIW